MPPIGPPTPPKASDVARGDKKITFPLAKGGKEMFRDFEPVACMFHAGTLDLGMDETTGQPVPPPPKYGDGFDPSCDSCKDTLDNTLAYIKRVGDANGLL
jgi:hypothetical protein